ncbi:MAG: carbohydrate kinase family protein [Anaerolineales bacterium]|nr:carbohydrate kinase family protein [Anaerolineales bacterium]
MTPKQFDVAVVGNVGIDTNVYLYGQEIDFAVEANFSENVDYVGQAGGYTSRGYARLGYRTAFIGSVGDDVNGRFIRDTFTQDSIDTTAVFADPLGTHRSVNIMYRDGRRKNFYDGKGHMTLQPDLDLCRHILSQSRLAHFHLPNWARLLLPIAKTLGIPIACDIQDVVDPDDPYWRDFIDYADVLFFSAVNHPDPTPIIHHYLQRNPAQLIIVGRGAEGAVLGSRDGIRFFPPIDLPQPVIDTNGAGDGLAVGFLASYLLDRYDLVAAVQRGQIVARYTCTQKASSAHLITAAQLNHYSGQNLSEAI